MKKILLLTITAFLISSSILPAVASAYGYSEEIPVTEEYNYYSYLAEKNITEALYSYPGLSQQQIFEILMILENNGYFLLKTVEEKKKFLRQHFQAPYIGIISQIEIRNRWHVPPADLSQVNSDESRRVQEALTERAQVGFDSWSEIRNRIIKRCGTGGSHDPGITNFQYQPSPQFGRKACWNAAELETFYSEHPEWRANRGLSQFTEEELKFLGLLESTLQSVGGQAIGGGVLGGTALEDLLILVPIPFVDKGVVWILKKVGGRVIPVIMRPLAGFSERMAGGAIGKVALRFDEWYIRTFINKYYNVVWDMRLVFKRSSLTGAEREEVIRVATDLLRRLSADDDIGRFFTSLEASSRIKINLENLILERLDTTGGRYGYQDVNRIVFDEFGWKMGMAGSGRAARGYLFHEITHAASSEENQLLRRMYFCENKGYYPLEEGVTEMISKHFIEAKYLLRYTSKYDPEIKVADALESALMRKLGANAGREKLREFYFKTSLKHIDDVLGEGTHDTIHCMMRFGMYDDAIKYLDGL